MLKNWLWVTLICLSLITCQNSSDTSNQTQNSGYKNISPVDVCKIVKKNPRVVFLDVRSKEEFNGELGHFKNAIQIPIAQLVPQFEKIENYFDKEVIVYCRMGGRSKKACEVLIFNHFKNVKNLDGGLLNWHNSSSDSLTCKDDLIVYEKTK